MKILGSALLALFCLVSAYAQPDRLTGRIDESARVVLRGHVSPQIGPQNDDGPVEPSFRLQGMTINFKPSPAQQQALDRLLEDQQNPTSTQFHKWLTPEEYADRFGLSRPDIAKVSVWLRSHGFKIGHAARGRQWIVFSGTADQVHKAFQVEIRHYRVHNKLHHANSADPSIPAAFRDIVLGIQGLDDFVPEPGGHEAVPEMTSSTGLHTLAPDDYAIIYDIMPLYQAGIDGSGQKLVIVGQSQLDLNDMSLFRKMFNLPPQDLRIVLVPDIGDPGVTGAQTEGNLDVQWSGAVARNAQIIYVYSFSAYTAMAYAIDQNLAPVASASYNMGCEQQRSLITILSLRLLAQQASAEGFTWVNSGGDTGAAACDANGTAVAQNGLTVRFPASIPEVTAVGGTEFNEQTGIYWSPTNTPNGASALSYIPEMVWNDSVLNQRPTAGGGGASMFFTQPSWQQGPGVPNNGRRNMPDVSLNSSASHDGANVVVAGGLRRIGGTSAAAPAFAGILALLNQYLVSTQIQAQPGLGNVNPRLYNLAQAAPNSFHDVLVGGNMVPCVPGSPDCVNGLVGYSAGPGYDQASGLGSPDVNNLVLQWSTLPAATSVVAVSYDQNPVYQQHDPDAKGFFWTVNITLTEEGGVPTALTGFSINGQAQDLATVFPSSTLKANGSITGVVGLKTLTVPATLTFAITGQDASGAQWSQSFSLPFLGPLAPIQIAGVSNAASGQLVFAPGMLMSIYGAQLAPTTQAAGAIPLLGFMGGITVTVNGFSAPLYYMSASQVNVQIPYETLPGTARVTVNNGPQSASFTFTVAASGVGIFAANGAPVPFASGARGQTLILFITGEGLVSPFLLDGNTPPPGTPISSLPKPILPVTMTIGGLDTPIVFAGIASGLVGVTQINFRVPPDAALGVQPLVVKVGNSSSAPVNFTVTQ
jgi:uncharacterized protein (TIGR03437 family)